MKGAEKLGKKYMYVAFFCDPTSLVNVYYSSMCTSDTQIVVATNSTRVLPMCSGGVATNSTCVSGAPCSCLNSRSSSDSQSGK